MAASIIKAPRKLSPFHYYIKEYYRSRVKDEYTRRYTMEKKKYDDATDDDREAGVVTMPVALQLRTKICMEFWNLETDEFRKEVAQEAEKNHLEELEEWKANQEAPKTPQQFHQ